MTPVLLVVDDDAAFRELVVDILADSGYRLIEAASGDQALKILAETRVDLVLTDQRMPGLGGLELARRASRAAEPPSVVVMTAYGTIPDAVEAVHAGAADYLTKPLKSPEALRQLVRRILGERNTHHESGEFLTRDPAALEVLALADRAAATDATVLIVGESGTGKELLARRLHRGSRRSSGPFVAVNCAAIPESLAESELFGHERGAFTGAEGRRVGRFEAADGGTLFLDEVGELPEAQQAKLLRALEERAIERVGGSLPIPVDLRVVAATNRNLEVDVEEGRFRADLYYRFNVVQLQIPPLRERPGDIAWLAERLGKQACERLSVPCRPLSQEAIERLEDHSWPGNVRELRNVLERALIAAAGTEVTTADLPILDRGPKESSEAETQHLSLHGRERQAILEALNRSEGHRERAAELLGISVRTLYNRLKEYGIR